MRLAMTSASLYRLWVCFAVSLAVACGEAYGAAQAPPSSPGAATPPRARNSPQKPPARKPANRPPTLGQDDQPLAALQKHFDAAQSAEQQMDFVRAESEYRQALGMALEQLGEAHETLGDLKPAQAAFQGAVAARSDSETALLGLAVVCLRNEQFQKGVDSV